MYLLNQSFDIKKKEVLKKHNLGKFLKNSIDNLKSNNFTVYKTKKYSANFKYSFVTIIYDSKNDDLFFKSLNSIIKQNLEDIELIIINNGAKLSFLNKLNNFLKGGGNISIIDNPIPEFDKKNEILYDPIFGLINLGLLLSRGKLFSYLSWDDEISHRFCYEIFKKYEQTGLKCYAPIPKAIDINSKIIESDSKKLNDSFRNVPDIVDSIVVIKNKISGGKNKKLFLSPGELLVYERKFIISRQGYDVDLDISQYLKNAAGEKIVLVRNAILFWRYHENQAHRIQGKFQNSNTIKRIREIFEETEIFQLHLKLYGLDWARKIERYYKRTRIIDFITTNIIWLIQNKNFNFIKFFNEIKNVINFSLFFSILIKLTIFYLKRLNYWMIYICLNPKKIIKKLSSLI